MAGEIGRALGLTIPEIVFVNFDEALGRNEPDEEIAHLLRASIGLNLALDYLPGSVMFDPAAGDVADAVTASRAVWFDAFITNVDRTAQNPNLLFWHRTLYFIDHGAALYFHHNWQAGNQNAASRFPQIRKHVLLPWATDIDAADRELRPLLTKSVFADIAAAVPDQWLLPQSEVATVSARRDDYVQYFMERLGSASNFVEEAVRAHAQLV